MESGSVSVCLFTGDGFTEAQVSDSLNPKPQFIKSDDSNTYAEKQNNKIFADINGDKKADIVALGLKEVVKKTPFLFTLDGFFVESMDINEYEPTASLAILFSDTSSNDLITTNYTYDDYTRLKKLKSGEEEIEYFYDDSVQNAKGKVIKVKDGSGETSFVYDKKGNVVERVRSIEDYKIKFGYVYDSMNRIVKIVYPDGTIVSYVYDTLGLSEIKMDTKDGKVKNKKLIGYKYDEKENKFTRTFGNGVVTELGFNPTSGHLTSSKLTTGTTKRIEENKKYSYDTSGNITKINDSANTWRSQTFSYDTYNRLTKSTGSYGEEEYTYTSNGNLTKKGKTTMGYSETDHAHAVSLVKTPYETHTYEYDESGYITKKDNDTFTHDDFGRLSSIVTGFGEEFNYFYDYKGRRTKKINRKKDEATYYFEDGLYEIHVAPNVAQRYTLYVKNGDELIAQWTRTDAVLENAESGFVSFVNLENQLFLFIFLILLIAWFGYAHQADKAWSFPERSVTLSLSKGLRARYIFALSLIGVILITCAKNKDAFPFAAIVSGITSETPSVNDASSQNPGDGGGGGTANAPVEGLYFFHTDHLDSVTMLTGTGGELVAGSSIGSGRSIVSYTPYGEIDREHSGGPDIYRYKYTGQEEDKETGLYYYKARYYDSKIGRFLQPDTVMEVSSPFGANQYMYVEGNPVMYNDPTGHWKLNGKRSNFQRLSHKFGNLMKRAQKEIAYAQKMNKQAEQIQMFLTTPGGLENAFVMYWLARYLGKPKHQNTLFGHKYTWDGNRDQFTKFFSKESYQQKWFELMYISTEVLGIPKEQFEAFYGGILPHLRAKPKSFADSLAQRHDDDVVGGQLEGDMKKHRSADAHYYKHWGDGLLTGRGGFWEQPLDSIFVGGGGSYLFLTHDVCVTRTTNDFARAICLGLLF